jgi:hypothetical protein
MCLYRPSAFVLLALLVSVAGRDLTVRAQLSPNCERNGRRDYCAITPVMASPQKPSHDLVTFADHTVVAVMRNEASCRNVSERIRTCHAWITIPPGNSKSIPAYYRGTYYEGGYRNEYVGKGIHITYTYLD